MKSKIKTVALVASAHFVTWWAIVGALKASGFRLFTFESLFGFAPPPRYSVVQVLLFYADMILSLPALLLPAHNVLFPDYSLAQTLTLALNSTVWGLCVTLVFYGVRQRRQRHAA